MAFQSVPNVAEAIVRMSVAGSTIINTFYGSRVAGYTLGDINDLAIAVDAWVGGSYLLNLSSDLGYIETVVTGLENENDFQVSNSTNAGVGAVPSGPTTNSVAFCVTRRSALTGRSARGRVYVPINQAQLQADKNYMNAASAQAIEDSLNAVRAAMLAAGWIEVIVSRFSNKAVRPLGVAFGVEEYTYRNLRVDSQRGRMPAED